MSPPLAPGRSVIVSVGPPLRQPWWWDDIRKDPGLCALDYVRINFRSKRDKQITALELPFFLLKLLRHLLAIRGNYDYVYTVECDFAGLGIAFWQSLLFMKRPRHVILQFIMREKTPRLASRLKYRLMKFMFRSLHRAVCSSRSEAEYYREVFEWAPEKARFVPLLTDPRHVADEVPEATGDYVLAAGRVFRDYATAVAAVRGTGFRLVIVGAAGVRSSVAADDQVSVLEEIPAGEFARLVRECVAVIVPLTDRKISTGQTVILQAMAMGKMVIATRTAGTTDYIDHMVNGVLVNPGDVDALRSAIGAAADRALRFRLGHEAREAVIGRHLPHHYTADVRAAVGP